MDTEPGRTLILWSVRLSVALYAMAIGRAVLHPGSTKSDRVFSALWVTSFLACVIHVLFAFHFEHHWSHQEAYRHTAAVTGRGIGIYWGGGLYVNYLFLLFWGASAVSIFFGASDRVGPTMQLVAAFMMFNATAVFGPSWWWFPVSGFTLFVLAMLVRHRNRPADKP